MRVVKVIQPHEFGDNFILEDGKWKVKFPPIATSGVEVSKDANNLITLGTDGGMFVDATRIHAYALVQDNENMKIHLYRHQANVEFDIATATLINSIDMLELNGRFDDITITDAVVTFKDVQTDTELEFDTEQFQSVEELSFDWPLSAEKDDKFKVGATDRIEITLVSGTVENQGDLTEFTLFDPTFGTVLYHRYEGDIHAMVDTLNANIHPFYTNGIAFELVSILEVGQTTETKLAIVNLSGENKYLGLGLSTHRVAEIAEPVKAEISGTPSYRWNDRQYDYSYLSFYLAASGTIIEDNGISPTASVIDLYVPKYINENFLENALVKTPEGLLVLPIGMEIQHTLEARSYQADVPDDEIEIEEFVRTINGNEIRMPAVTLKNVRGKTLGAIVAKIPDKLHTYEPR